jgi:ATP-dependent helicase/nuclease subunit B
VRALGERDLEQVRRLSGLIFDALQGLPGGEFQPFPASLQAIISALKSICEPSALADLDQTEFPEITESLFIEGRRLPHCTIKQAAAILRQCLETTPRYERDDRRAAVTIMGTLEARLVRPDIVILAGLNEGVWPGQPDAGPWLNRPMRSILEVQQPEVQIGQMAHDFVQGLGASKVVLTYSLRDDKKPLTPSRWVLRLQTILRESGLKFGTSSKWKRLVATLDAQDNAGAMPIPMPCPPVAVRPKELSVTQIETLIKDPYAIYARKILKLEPLEMVGMLPNAAVRGRVYHLILSKFFLTYPFAPPPDAQAEIRAIAARYFAPIENDQGVAAFWRPRLDRVADWIIENRSLFYGEGARLHAEIKGRIPVNAGGEDFALTARADLIVQSKDSTAAIYDFKTGTIPNASETSPQFSPQLTLEAAMLDRNGFEGIEASRAETLAYVKISGGVPPVDVGRLSKIQQQDWERHFSGLERLIASYFDPGQPYLPRARIQGEDETKPFDHLSRYREWTLSRQEP